MLNILGVAHTGITVSDIDRSISFYRDVLGFAISDKLDCKGPIYEQVTGVKGAEMTIVYVHAPGHTIELLQYHRPAERQRVIGSPCDTGALHIAFKVEDIETVVDVVRRAGLSTVTSAVPVFPEGRSEGLKAIYAIDPDGVTIEFVEYPRAAAP